jgi:hypothetical protein
MSNATVVRGVLVLGEYRKQHTAYRAELLDATGRHVMGLVPGANDVRHLASGVYYVIPEAVNGRLNTGLVRKVVVTK